MSLLTLPLRLLPPETAHDLAIRALARRSPALSPPRPVRDMRLAITVAGIDFANPVGVAAGVDKNATAVGGLLALGFGSVEVGTLTPHPQEGNPKPRLFRLTSDRALINRMGFNNDGIHAALARLERLRREVGVIGINVGANRDSTDRIADYIAGVSAAAPIGDYVAINVSSPNTPGLRDHQHGEALAELLAGCRETAGTTPLFLKVAPDLTAGEIDGIARAAIDHRIGAIVIGNTTTSRPPLTGRHAGEAGGLSGAPLAPLARRALAAFRAATGGALPLVSVGGIGDAREAYVRIRAGASLVQVYTSFVRAGPKLGRQLPMRLADLIARDGFTALAQAIGAG